MALRLLEWLPQAWLWSESESGGAAALRRSLGAFPIYYCPCTCAKLTNTELVAIHIRGWS